MRQLPNNRNAEIGVLAGILLRNEALKDVSAIVDTDAFYVPAHRAVYAAMVKLAERGQPIDPVTLEHQLRSTDELNLVGGLEGLGKLTDRYASSHHVVQHAEIVASVATVRRLVQVARQLDDEGTGQIEDAGAWLDAAQRRVIEATQGAAGSRRYRPLHEIVHEEFGRVAAYGQACAAARRNGEPVPLTGIATGFAELDDMTSGLQPSELTILAARPSMGKTALAINLAEQVAAAGEPVLVFSMEMSQAQLTRRMLRIDSRRLRAGDYSEKDYRQIAVNAESLTRLPISLDERGALSIREIRAASRAWRTDPQIFPRDGRKRTGLIVVDYLQLANDTAGKHQRKDLEVGAISAALKALAKELKLPVLALSQLSRDVDKRNDHRPQLGDLRESGAIEQDADMVWFLYRASRYITDPRERAKVERDAEVIIAKARNGEIGTVHLEWIGAQTRFRDRRAE